MNKQGAKEISAEQQIAFFHKVFDEKKDWNISSGKWLKLNVKLVFQSSPYLFAKTLELYGNKEPKIIKLIIGPEMDHLVLLNLRNNRINSIEGLSELKSINLRQLLLGDNDIVSIRPLIKMRAPVLETISLYSNRVNDIKDLYSLDTLHLTTLILGLNSIANFGSLNKCSWTKLRMLSIENNRRCHNINILLQWPINGNTEVIC